MRISQLAERSGVPATTLRFYEGTGPLPAGRTPDGSRVYGEDVVERLAFIGAAKHLGLPLEEIGELLGVWEAGACRDVKADLRPRIAARLAKAESRAAELAAFAPSLRTALEHLDAVPDGLRLTLPVDRTARVAELAAAEQRCCPFFDFRLHLNGPHLYLEVRAPADGAALLAGLFASAA
ncbi:MerR family transcriptional regulator [Streptomyces sp. NPDC056169]|uniref:MerR family transcriptional regulator n=1 Tax=Streptomyces sp. NPDC056169 TaxID=3345734 RepID=UPI0035E3394F